MNISISWSKAKFSNGNTCGKNVRKINEVKHKTETDNEMGRTNLTSMTYQEVSTEATSEKEKLSNSISSPDNIKTEKRFTKILLECVVSTSRPNNALQGVLIKTKSEVGSQYHNRPHTRWKICMFLSNKKYFEESTWAECLKL